MKLPALLSALLFCLCGITSAAPVITQLRVTTITGNDDLRGGSSAAEFYLWFHGSPDYVRVRRDNTHLDSHSAHTETFAVGPFDLATLSNVGVYFYLPHSIIGATTFLFDEPDQWDLDGIIVTGITATGEEYEIYHRTNVNHRFVRLNLYTDDSWRVDWWKSPLLNFTGSDSSTFDEFHLQLRTGSDDLRPGSKAYCEVQLTNGWRFEQPLMTRPVRFADHSSFSNVFRLPRRVDPAEIATVSLRFEGQNSGGSTDEWRLLGWSLTAGRGLSTREIITGVTERLRRVLTHDFTGIHFQSSRRHTVVVHGSSAPPTDGTMDVTVKTGGDDFRDGSKAYLRLLLNDGGLVELPLNDGSTSWGSNSSEVVSLDLPAWLQLRHIRDFAIRYESGRRSGFGDDQWTLRRVSINYDSSIVSVPGLVHDSGDVDHHFPESATWRSSLGVAVAPLVEKPDHLLYTLRGLLIPLLATAPFLGDDALPYQEWLGLLQQNPSRWSSLLQAPPEVKFRHYVFGLFPEQRPGVELELLPPAPESFGREFRLRFSHLLSLQDVNFVILHSSDLVQWEPVLFSFQKDWAVVPDLVGRKEWREVTLWGAPVSEGKHYFRVEALPLNQ